MPGPTSILNGIHVNWLKDEDRWQYSQEIEAAEGLGLECAMITIGDGTPRLLAFDPSGAIRCDRCHDAAMMNPDYPSACYFDLDTAIDVEGRLEINHSRAPCMPCRASNLHESCHWTKREGARSDVDMEMDMGIWDSTGGAAPNSQTLAQPAGIADPHPAPAPATQTQTPRPAQLLKSKSASKVYHSNDNNYITVPAKPKDICVRDYIVKGKRNVYRLPSPNTTKRIIGLVHRPDPTAISESIWVELDDSEPSRSPGRAKDSAIARADPSLKPAGRDLRKRSAEQGQYEVDQRQRMISQITQLTRSLDEIRVKVDGFTASCKEDNALNDRLMVLEARLLKYGRRTDGRKGIGERGVLIEEKEPLVRDLSTAHV